MAKTITIRDDVYEKLVALKGNESFSELIERLIEGKGIDILKKIRERMMKLNSDVKWLPDFAKERMEKENIDYTWRVVVTKKKV